ncbi:MAG: 50S ribosomal protein L29 [archaeon]
MAIIRKRELSSMNKDELVKKGNDLKLELLKANAVKASKTSPKKIREIRRTIARIFTKMNSIKKNSEKKTQI